MKKVLILTVACIAMVACKKEKPAQVCPLTNVKGLVETTDAAGWHQYTGTYTGNGVAEPFYIDADHDLTDCELMALIKQ